MNLIDDRQSPILVVSFHCLDERLPDITVHLQWQHASTESMIQRWAVEMLQISEDNRSRSQHIEGCCSGQIWQKKSLPNQHYELRGLAYNQDWRQAYSLRESTKDPLLTNVRRLCALSGRLYKFKICLMRTRGHIELTDVDYGLSVFCRWKTTSQQCDIVIITIVS